MDEGKGRRCEAGELGSSSPELLLASRRILQRGRPLGEKDERERGMPSLLTQLATQWPIKSVLIFFLKKRWKDSYAPHLIGKIPKSPLNKNQGFYTLSLEILSLSLSSDHLIVVNLFSLVILCYYTKR